jgi:hypothetical protein
MTPGQTPGLPSDDAIKECAYLVERGVRAMALIGGFRADKASMDVALDHISNPKLSGQDTIPFVVDKGDGIAMCGYASERWVVDLYRWTAANAPPDIAAMVTGLLLGYSPEAVRRYLDRGSELRRLRPETARNPTQRP